MPAISRAAGGQLQAPVGRTAVSWFVIAESQDIDAPVQLLNIA